MANLANLSNLASAIVPFAGLGLAGAALGIGAVGLEAKRQNSFADPYGSYTHPYTKEYSLPYTRRKRIARPFPRGARPQAKRWHP